jgi:hypothetical protein
MARDGLDWLMPQIDKTYESGKMVALLRDGDSIKNDGILSQSDTRLTLCR